MPARRGENTAIPSREATRQAPREALSGYSGGSSDSALFPGFRGELLRVDHETLMPSFAHSVEFVVHPYLENETPSVDLGQLRLNSYLDARRSRCRMGEVDASTHRLLSRPVEMREDGLYARPLDEAHEVSGGEHLRHAPELWRLREEGRYRLARRYPVTELVFDAGPQRSFHGTRIV